MRVDVADPTEEGPLLAQTLSRAGFDVATVSLEATPPSPFRARLVVLAGDVPGALPALDRLRQRPDTEAVPVLVVGRPPGGAHDVDTLRKLGADAVYDRPVPIERLLRKVQTYLTPAEELRRSAAEDSGGVVGGVTEREPTAPPTEPPSREPSAPEPTVRLPPEGTDRWAEDAWQPPRVPSEEPSSSAGPRLSTHLAQLVHAADRRLFPDAPQLDVTVADPGDALELMLGDDLMAPAPLPDEPDVEHEPSAIAAGQDDSAVDATTAMVRVGTQTPREVPTAAPASGELSGVSPVAQRRVVASGRVLGADVPSLLLEAASARYGPEDVRARLGPGGHVRLAADAHARLGRLGFPAELVAWVERHDGEMLEAWLAAEPPGATSAGVLLVLAELDVLSVHEVETGPIPVERGRAALRARIAAAHAVAEDGDYFAILGVPPDAGSEEIAAAHDARRHELLAAGALDPDLTERRRIALDALAEARRILSVPRLREAYRRALDAAP